MLRGAGVSYLIDRLNDVRRLAMLRRLLLRTVWRIASDPRVQAKAAEVYGRDVKPRAKAAWEGAKPKLNAVRDDVKRAADAADPRESPVKFAAELKNRLTKSKGESDRD